MVAISNLQHLLFNGNVKKIPCEVVHTGRNLFHENNLIFIVLSLYLVVKKEKKSWLPPGDLAQTKHMARKNHFFYSQYISSTTWKIYAWSMRLRCSQKQEQQYH
jgi:hypothetical protein